MDWTSQLTRYIMKNFSSHYKVSYCSVCKCCGHATANKKNSNQFEMKATFNGRPIKFEAFQQSYGLFIYKYIRICCIRVWKKYEWYQCTFSSNCYIENQDPFSVGFYFILSLLLCYAHSFPQDALPCECIWFRNLCIRTFEQHFIYWKSYQRTLKKK